MQTRAKGSVEGNVTPPIDQLEIKDVPEKEINIPPPSSITKITVSNIHATHDSMYNIAEKQKKACARLDQLMREGKEALLKVQAAYESKKSSIAREKKPSEGPGLDSFQATWINLYLKLEEIMHLIQKLRILQSKIERSSEFNHLLEWRKTFQTYPLDLEKSPKKELKLGKHSYSIENKPFTAGGWGEIYHAQQLETGKKFILKLLRPNHFMVKEYGIYLNQGVRIEKPFLLQKNAEPYIGLLMEHLGKPLNLNHIKEMTKWNVPYKLKAAKKLAENLTLLHANNIIHADMSGNNILMAIDKYKLHMNIIDFGTSQYTSMHNKPIISCSYTPNYAPKESSYKIVSQRYRVKESDYYSVAFPLADILKTEAKKELLLSTNEKFTFAKTLQAELKKIESSPFMQNYQQKITNFITYLEKNVPTDTLLEDFKHHLNGILENSLCNDFVCTTTLTERLQAIDNLAKNKDYKKALENLKKACNKPTLSKESVFHSEEFKQPINLEGVCQADPLVRVRPYVLEFLMQMTAENDWERPSWQSHTVKDFFSYLYLYQAYANTSPASDTEKPQGQQNISLLALAFICAHLWDQAIGTRPFILESIYLQVEKIFPTYSANLLDFFDNYLPSSAQTELKFNSTKRLIHLEEKTTQILDILLTMRCHTHYGKNFNPSTHTLPKWVSEFDFNAPENKKIVMTLLKLESHKLLMHPDKQVKKFILDALKKESYTPAVMDKILQITPFSLMEFKKCLTSKAEDKPSSLKLDSNIEVILEDALQELNTSTPLPFSMPLSSAPLREDISSPSANKTLHTSWYSLGESALQQLQTSEPAGKPITPGMGLVSSKSYLNLFVSHFFSTSQGSRSQGAERLKDFSTSANPDTVSQRPILVSDKPSSKLGKF